MAMNPRLLRPTQSLDADAAVYLAAVEAADGEPLEPAVRKAVDTFFRDTKAAGVFSALKACCILAGARTLSGALVPLAGTAPTNNNFIAADYTRGGATPGLKGNASNKYIDTNRPHNASPKSDQHAAVYITSLAADAGGIVVGSNPAGGTLGDLLIVNRPGTNVSFRCATGSLYDTGSAADTGFVGCSRSQDASYSVRFQATNQTVAEAASSSIGSLDTFAFCQNNDGTAGNFDDSRVSFYSIGDALDLEALDDAVSTLITAIGAAV